eukprot:GFYU01004875.1.p1 GENE.GFYU01004875.1~~GFYU01004875.1.p1  ORF type:complete len:608 (-),score=123.94 GFYU01004875.1:242-2065(-)
MGKTKVKPKYQGKDIPFQLSKKWNPVAYISVFLGILLLLFSISFDSEPFFLWKQDVNQSVAPARNVPPASWIFQYENAYFEEDLAPLTTYSSSTAVSVWGSMVTTFDGCQGKNCTVAWGCSHVILRCSFEQTQECSKQEDGKKDPVCPVCQFCERARWAVLCTIVPSVVCAVIAASGLFRNWYYGWTEEWQMSRAGYVGALLAGVPAILGLIVYQALMDQRTNILDPPGLTTTYVNGWTQTIAIIGGVLEVLAFVLQILVVRGIRIQKYLRMARNAIIELYKRVRGFSDYVVKRNLIKGRPVLRSGDLVYISTRKHIGHDLSVIPTLLTAVRKDVSSSQFVSRWDRMGVLWRAEEGDPHATVEVGNGRALRNLFVLVCNAQGELSCKNFSGVMAESSDLAIQTVKYNSFSRRKDERKKYRGPLDKEIQEKLCAVVKDSSAFAQRARARIRMSLNKLRSTDTKRIQEEYNTLTEDGAKQLSITELEPLVERTYHHLPPRNELRNLLDALDVDKSGQVDYEEFETFYTHLEARSRLEAGLPEPSALDIIHGEFAATLLLEAGVLLPEADDDQHSITKFAKRDNSMKVAPDFRIRRVKPVVRKRKSIFGD